MLLTYRYVAVMMEEVSVMTEAYHLRAPGQKGIHISAWGSFLGQLLLRSMDRAEDLYESMQLRGFRGEFYYADSPKCTAGAVVFALGCAAFFAAARCWDLPQLLGNLIT
jgi:cobalt/nickel transport system permease protein